MSTGNTSKSRRIRQLGQLLGLGLAILAVFYVFASPLVRRFEQPSADSAPRSAIQIDTIETIRSRTVDVAVTLWCLAVGASFGSFVNVVAYRLPRGRTLLGNSHCPNCNIQIPVSHNVPILSWFALNGRCATCRLPIPPRYVVAEWIVGFLFVAVLLLEVCRHGHNLPGPDRGGREGLMWTLLAPKWDLIGIAVYHVALLTLLFTVALVEFDRVRVPRSLVLFGLLVGLVCGGVWPHFHPVDVAGDTENASRFTRTGNAWNAGGLLASAAGLAAGMLLGMLLDSCRPARNDEARPRASWAIGTTLVGAFLGWQAALLVVAASAWITLAATVLGRIAGCHCRLVPAGSLAIASLGLIGSWATLANAVPLRWDAASLPWVVGLSAAALTAVWIESRVAGGRLAEAIVVEQLDSG